MGRVHGGVAKGRFFGGICGLRTKLCCRDSVVQYWVCGGGGWTSVHGGGDGVGREMDAEEWKAGMAGRVM